MEIRTHFQPFYHYDDKCYTCLHYLFLATDFGMFGTRRHRIFLKSLVLWRQVVLTKIFFFSFSSEDMNNPVQTDSLQLDMKLTPKTCSLGTQPSSITVFNFFPTFFLSGAGHTCTTSTKTLMVSWNTCPFQREFLSKTNKKEQNKTKKKHNTFLHFSSSHFFPLNVDHRPKAPVCSVLQARFWLMKRGLRVLPQKHHSYPAALRGRSQGTGRVRTQARGQNQRGEPWRKGKNHLQDFHRRKNENLASMFLHGRKSSKACEICAGEKREGRREKGERDINQEEKRCLWNHTDTVITVYNQSAGLFLAWPWRDQRVSLLPVLMLLWNQIKWLLPAKTCQVRSVLLCFLFFFFGVTVSSTGLFMGIPSLGNWGFDSEQQSIFSSQGWIVMRVELKIALSVEQSGNPQSAA